MTYIVSGGALISTLSLSLSLYVAYIMDYVADIYSRVPGSA